MQRGAKLQPGDYFALFVVEVSKTLVDVFLFKIFQGHLHEDMAVLGLGHPKLVIKHSQLLVIRHRLGD